MIKKLLCHKSKTLLHALKIINENGKGIVFVVDDGKRLRGVLTDGDIRRLLLKGHDLQVKISAFLNKKPVYACRGEARELILNKLTGKIQIIPIVDDAMQVVDYIEFRKDFHVPIISPDLKGNEFKYLVDAFLSTWISSQGNYIDLFERKFSKYIGCQHGVAVANGTAALHLALLACGVKPGDEVIVPDLTFAATINAVLHANAKPVIVDVEKESWCIDPDEIKKAITPRTKAIIPVHLYGQPCDMQTIIKIAKERKIYVIEDCAEAHGATFKGKKVGSLGDVGCFSFFGNKIITSGEGGMCVTHDTKKAEKIRMLKNHGMAKKVKYWHEEIGYSYRMTNLQAAIALAQLERIEHILKARRRIELDYKRVFSDLKFIEFQRDDLPNRKKITWLVSLLVKDEKQKKELMDKLRNYKIDARSFFFPLSKMGIYKQYVFSNANSCQISDRGICLPTGAADATRKTIERIKDIFSYA